MAAFEEFVHAQHASQLHQELRGREICPASDLCTTTVGKTFDGILVAAAPLHVPEARIMQLAIGGRLIVPAGPEGQQQLLRIVRREQGIERKVLGPVSFVPLVGGVG